jgi:hypothetical protein
MSRSIARTISKDVQSGLDDMSHALRKAADRLSDDAHEAVEEAGEAVREGARSLATTIPPIARDVTQKAVREVKAHPLVAATPARTAAAAVTGLLFRARRKAE